MRVSISRVLAVAVLPVAILSLSKPQANGPERSGAELVWPGPPAEPRIRFLGVISTPQDLDIGRGWLGRLRRAVKGGPARQIVRPHGIAKDSHGRLFVVDTFYRSVHVFDVNASRYYRFPANPIDGFLQPVGVAASGDGDVFVSDSEAGVIHFFREHGKKYVGLIGEDELERPTALVINVETGDLLAVDTLAGQVVVFDLATLEKKKVVGGKGSGEGRFNYPTGIALAADGTLHVVDSLNFRVQLLSSDYEFLREFGRAGDTPGHFSRPKGVAVDSERNTYVVDALFDNVQIFDPEGRLLLAFGSPGQGEGEFWLPNEIFVDGEDRVYVSDTYNQRLQVFQFLKAGSPR